MNRTPPAEVRRLLRKEVGFGCPVAGCDSPYLSWHHFEPPWEERQHHEPMGMVALCVLHHGQADARAFTVDQLRAFKDRDLNGAERRLSGQFHWRRDRLILLAGTNWWTGCEILLQCGSRPIIWLSHNDDHELLNLDLFDDRGVARLQMRDNDWVADREVDDLECAPRKADLVIKTETLGAELSISFARATADAVRRRALENVRSADRRIPAQIAERLPSVEERANSITQEVTGDIPEAESALCIVEGRLRWPEKITIEPTQLILPGNNRFSNCQFLRCQTAIQVN